MQDITQSTFRGTVGIHIVQIFGVTLQNNRKQGEQQLHGVETLVISTVQATWADGVTPSSLTHRRSSPVTKSHGVPWTRSTLATDTLSLAATIFLLTFLLPEASDHCRWSAGSQYFLTEMQKLMTNNSTNDIKDVIIKNVIIKLHHHESIAK